MKHTFIILALLALSSCGRQDVADREWHDDDYHHHRDDYDRDRGDRGHWWWPPDRSSNQK